MIYVEDNNIKDARSNKKMSREPKVTMAQKIVLLQFMEDHMDLAKGRMMGAEGHKRSLSQWETLACLLNSADGPQKTATKWQKVWADLKTKTKRKANDIMRFKKEADGEPLLVQKLSEFEENLIAFLGHDAVYKVQENEAPRNFVQPPQLQPSLMRLDDSEEVHVKEEWLDETFCSSTASTSSEAESEDQVVETATTSKRGFKRKRVSTTKTAISNFAELTNKVQQVNETLQELVKEKKTTNFLLRELIESIKNQ